MSGLPISGWAAIIGLLGIIALASGAWLLLRARDVARIAKGTDRQVVPGHRHREPARRSTVRLVLATSLFSTVGALGLLALVATRMIGSSETQPDPYAQRP